MKGDERMRRLLYDNAGRVRQARLYASRVLAIILGGFAMLNVLGECVRPGFDANVWWIDTRSLPGFLSGAFLLSGGLCLLVWAFRPRMERPERWVAGPIVAVLLSVCLANTFVFYELLLTGVIQSSMPIPFSLFVAGALLFIPDTICREPLPSRQVRRRPVRLAAGVAVILAASTVGQMYCFGKTDYRRRADAIVVFGAGVYADGRCSDALADRMRTAIRLYKQGYADRLVLSGGPGKGRIHETEAMRQMALGYGVPDRAIVLDRAGLNTRATVRNTGEIFDRLHCRRALAVSHFYHLPRIKLTYQRAGREVYTVPARESYTLSAMPYFMAREVAAMWAYYVRA